MTALSEALLVQEYSAASLVAEFKGRGNPLGDVEWRTALDYQIQDQAYLLVNTFKLPVDVLQQERVIASYPNGLWQHIRSKFTDNYRRKYVLLTEHLMFPDLPDPHPIGMDYRVYTEGRVTDYKPEEER